MTTITIQLNAANLDMVAGGLGLAMERAIRTGVRTRPCAERDQADASLQEIFGAGGMTLADEYEAAKANYLNAYDAMCVVRPQVYRIGDAEWTWAKSIEIEIKTDHLITDGEVR